jgi:hypothetical protein
MVSRHTKAHSSASGKELTLSSTTTDCPLLPIEQLERLARIAPERVNWVFEQTSIESAHRRNEHRRVHTLIFSERLMSIFCALVVALAGLASALYCAIINKEIAASVLGGATLVGMVTAFIAGKNPPEKTT